ncbi:MAG: ATP-binding protein [Opitutales bacterium]|jgi:signal transduction histidine kinase
MKTLSNRLTFWYTTVVMLTVGATLLFGRFFLEQYLVRGLDLMLEAEFEEIRARIDSPGDSAREAELLEAVFEHAEIDEDLYFFQVNRFGGEIVFRSENLLGRDLAVTHGKKAVTLEYPDLGRLRSAEFSHNGLDIHIASSMKNIDLLFASYNRYSLYACCAVLLFSIGLGFLLSRIALNPIRSIQLSANEISASNFWQRIHVPDTGDEVARMAELLNAMLDRLEAAYTQVRRFTAEASHEFRTPLSIIRLQTERMLADIDMPLAERSSALCEQMEEVERLNKLIDDLLILAKADAGIFPLSTDWVELPLFVADFSDDARLLAQEEGIIFESVLEDVDRWVFDPSWIRRVLFNLLTNSLKASHPGTTIKLSLVQRGETLLITMEDEGPGIPEEHLVCVFERFQQSATGQEGSGSGLGLAICRSVVQQHKGSITAENRLPRGLRMEIRLPDTAPAPSVR